MSDRRIVPNTVGQGQHEKIAYDIDVTRWCRKGNAPTASSVTLLREDTGVDVTALNCVGASTLLGFVVTTPIIQNLIVDVHYRMNVSFTVDGNMLETWMIIVGEK